MILTVVFFPNCRNVLIVFTPPTFLTFCYQRKATHTLASASAGLLSLKRVSIKIRQLLLFPQTPVCQLKYTSPSRIWSAIQIKIHATQFAVQRKEEMLCSTFYSHYFPYKRDKKEGFAQIQLGNEEKQVLYSKFVTYFV